MEPVPGANTSIVFEGATEIAVVRSGADFLFNARDVGRALGQGDGSRFVKKLTEWGLNGERHTARIANVPNRDIHESDHSGGKAMVWLTEPGLYRALMRSRAPKAEAFQEWLATDVLPTLRRTGQYSAPDRGGVVSETETTAPARTGAVLRELVAELRAERDPMLRGLLIRAAELDLGEDLRSLLVPPMAPPAPVAPPPPALPSTSVVPARPRQRPPGKPGPVEPAAPVDGSPRARLADAMVRAGRGDLITQDIVADVARAVLDAPPEIRARVGAVAALLFDAARQDAGRLELVEQVAATPQAVVLRLVAAALRAGRLPAPAGDAFAAQVDVLLTATASAA